MNPNNQNRLKEEESESEEANGQSTPSRSAPPTNSSSTTDIRPVFSSSLAEKSYSHPIPGDLHRYEEHEDDDGPNNRKRRKLSEYAHLDAIHAYRTQQSFSKLQRSAHSGRIFSSAMTDVENEVTAVTSNQDSEDDREVDVLGDDEDEDGHFVLSNQYQVQRDSVRRKRRRSFQSAFVERRESMHERAYLEPRPEWPTARANTALAHQQRPRTAPDFGGRRHRHAGAYDQEPVDDEEEDDREGMEVDARALYASTNVIVSKEADDAENIVADIVDEVDTSVVSSTSSLQVSNEHMPPSPRSPEGEATSKRTKRNRRQSEPPAKERRSARLNAVKVVEYEYDVDAQDHFDPITISPSKPLSRRSSSAKRDSWTPSKSSSLNIDPRTPQSDPTSKSKKRPRSSMTPKTPTASRVRHIHGIVTVEDIHRFYTSLRPTHYQQRAPQPKGMVPVLFNYQLRAVSWMTERESKLFMRDGVRGGILADEMGLGKTIEMMGLILSNPREKFRRPPPPMPIPARYTNRTPMTQSPVKIQPDMPPPHLPTHSLPTSEAGSNSMDTLSSISMEDNHSLGEEKQLSERAANLRVLLKFDEFVDPPADCHDSSCTLIVCPDILLPQWKEEMERHAPSLRVHTYTGVPNLSSLEQAMDSIGENIFSLYDVILCSYETLAKEFPYATTPNVKTRFQREQPSTPLTKLRWWRLVMDEAQMFSQGASNAGKLLQNLKAVNRWAVSGTPIRKDFSDIRGLLLFLGAEEAYFRPTPQALSFIRQIAWRHQMEQVSEDIIIPPSETHLIEVTLSPLETFGITKLASKWKVSVAGNTLKNITSEPTPSSASMDEDIIHTPVTINPSTSGDNSQIALASTAAAAGESYNYTETLSLQSGKYASCPYQVLLDRFLEQRSMLRASDRNLLGRSLSTHIANEFYGAQLTVCRALNSYGDLLLLAAKRLQSRQQATTRSDSKEEGDDSSLINEFISNAIALYTKSLELVTYKADTLIHRKLVVLRTPSLNLSPPSSPFSTVWYHTLVNLVEALRLQNRTEEALELEQRSEAVRTTALQSQLNSVATSRYKFNSTKQETSRLIRNRLNFARGEWWYHALKWIGANVPDFCARLRRGVKQQFDYQFQLLRTHTLQLNVATVEDVIDKLDLDLTRLQKCRSEAIELSKTPVPLSGAQLPEFMDILDRTDEALFTYQQLLVKEVEIDGWSGVVQNKVLNLAERLLLHIEFVIVERHNALMSRYRFHPDSLTPEQETTLFQLARWLLMAEATFRELELMKIEVEHAQTYNKVKREYSMSLSNLEHSALPYSLLEENDADISLSSMDVDEALSNNPPDKEDSLKFKDEEVHKDSDAPNTSVPTSSVVPLFSQTNGTTNSMISSTRFKREVRELRERLQSSVESCIQLKHQLEFVVESTRAGPSRTERYGTKIAMVAQKLLEVLQDDPEQIANPSLLRNKALVFSKWSEPLAQLAAILEEHKVQYRFGKDAGPDGQRAGNLILRLAAFRDDPEVRVLFLNSRSQSTGLTLTQANHVFILEDIEPAHEQQAIGRANRIGQTRPTHIWKVQVRPGDVPSFEEDVSDLMKLETSVV